MVTLVLPSVVGKLPSQTDVPVDRFDPKIDTQEPGSIVVELLKIGTTDLIEGTALVALIGFAVPETSTMIPSTVPSLGSCTKLRVFIPALKTSCFELNVKVVKWAQGWLQGAELFRAAAEPGMIRRSERRRVSRCRQRPTR